MARVIWWASAVLLVGAVIWAWMTLPEQGVPQHTGLTGVVDRYGTRTEFVGAMAALSVLILVVVPGIVRWSLKGDAPFLNIRNRSYWLAPERAEATKAEVVRRLRIFLAGSNLLIATIVVGMTLAVPTGKDPLQPWALIGFAIAAVAWMVADRRRFGRIPE